MYVLHFTQFSTSVYCDILYTPKYRIKWSAVLSARSITKIHKENQNESTV